MNNKPKKTNEGSLGLYFKAVEGTKMLTAAEERGHIRKYIETRDPRAKDLILKGALRYVIAEARKNPRSLRDQTIMEDLIAAGNIGLLRALDKFDINAGTRFLTYASWWVKHEMREESRRLGLVHVPAHAIAKGTRAPATTELMENVMYSRVEKDYRDAVHDHQSILKLLDCTPLTVRETFIVKACFGIHTSAKTLKQIGCVLAITGERVRQLRENALVKLRTTSGL